MHEQRSLFKECFPENVDTSVEEIKHYLWKFHSYPSQPKSYEYSASLDDEIVGYYAALPYSYYIKGIHFNVGMVCDVMTGLKARNKGIFTKLGIYATAELKNEGIHFTTGFPIRQEVIPGHLKAGWQKMFPLPLYINFLSSKGLLCKKKIKFLVPIIDLFFKVYSLFFSVLQKSKDYDISFHSSLDLDRFKDLDIFFDTWISEQDIALAKNLKFLKWRLSAPEKEYKIVIAKKNNLIVGYAVFCNVVKNNVPSIAILDISCLKNHRKLSSTIISFIQDYANLHKYEAILIMANKKFSNYHGLVYSGFLRSPFKFWFIIKILNYNLSFFNLFDQKQWHLTWIDSDDL